MMRIDDEEKKKRKQGKRVVAGEKSCFPTWQRVPPNLFQNRVPVRKFEIYSNQKFPNMVKDGPVTPEISTFLDKNADP